MSIKKLALFLVILVAANLHLLKPGLWTFQDAAYWPKNTREAYMLVSQQLQTFTTYGYSLGFEQGLFTYSRIFSSVVIWGLFLLFGAGGSQATFSVIGYGGGFAAFYLFSGLFFSDKNLRYWLSILYAFTPLVTQLQGHTFYIIAIPLFLYSIKKLIFEDGNYKFGYLLLSIIAGFIWVAYIRFIQAFVLVIIPYLVYWLLKEKDNFRQIFKKSLITMIFFGLAFLPISFSFFSQITDKNQTAFNYSNVYGGSVIKEPFYKALNLLPSYTIRLYDNKVFTGLGIILFGAFLAILAKYAHLVKLKIFYLNLFLVWGALFIFGAGNILPKYQYFSLIKWLPFVTNNPYFALFVCQLPLVMVIGFLIKTRYRLLVFFTMAVVWSGIIPFLNPKESKLNNLQLSQVPQTYQKLFNHPEKNTIPTYYFGNTCWRAKYMEELKVPTSCLNWGQPYTSIMLADPRLVWGDTLNIDNIMKNNTMLNNLRITHNLKSVIVPNDLASSKDQQKAKIFDVMLGDNSQLTKDESGDFNLYTYKNRKDYEYFLYSPKKILKININELATADIDINDRPVINSQDNIEISQSPDIFYKYNQDNPEYIWVKASNIVNNKPWMLQLNQKFSNSWNLVLIDKNYYDSIPCKGNINDFPVTGNITCIANSTGGLLKNLVLKEAKDSGHYQSNILSNGWWITSNNSPEQYYLIYYVKQPIFTLMVYVSAISLVFILLLTILRIRHDKYN